ncbi:MAG: hypothetical protein ACOCXA_05845 [Planctomycetota bacterium]
MHFDVSRDFLDGVLLQHPQMQEGKMDVQANANLQFLPSSSDGTMHTAIVTLRIVVTGNEKPFAQGGWRFLYTTDESFDPKENSGNPFLQRLLVAGSSKILAVLNPLCMHANMPLIPLDTQSMVRGLQEHAQRGGPTSAQTGTVQGDPDSTSSPE